MNLPVQSILSYIKSNKVLTMATSANGQPYCAHCFYAFDADEMLLVFMSDADTRHISEALRNSRIGGTISTNVRSVARLRGIQFTGEMLIPDNAMKSRFQDCYYARFPFARAHRSDIWAIRLNHIKMTDNTLGFGTKLNWNRA